MRRGFEEGEEGKDRWNRQGKRVVEGCDERGGEGLDTDTLLYFALLLRRSCRYVADTRRCTDGDRQTVACYCWGSVK